MTELSGFTAVQPAAALTPQALQLPATLADVCTCETGCGASTILKGLAQIVGRGVTNLIEINIQNAPEGVRVAVIPWDKDGVAKNGVALPGGFIVIDGSKAVGMSPEQHAEWSGVPLPTPEPEPEDVPEEPATDANPDIARGGLGNPPVGP